ncbi:MAG: NAD(P)H-binding protein [Pseudomonadota bacterium]
MVQGGSGKRVLLFGATGTAGEAAGRALVRAGHDVVRVVRPGREAVPFAGETRVAEVSEAGAVMREGGFDAVVSCLASRTGAPRDTWAVDHDANLSLLRAAEAAGVGQFVLLSAICVQKPLLAFQRAKLAFEERLMASELTWSIVRPTAFFKSLSGQIARVQAGKPFLVFGDGRLTACKPISDDDLGDFITSCLADPDRQGRILPIGGPGPALTPLDQGRLLFEAAGRPARFRHVPVAMMDAIGGVARGLGLVSQRWADKAEFVRIGRYYATESMLVWDNGAGRYDADATPEFGHETLCAFYRDVIAGRRQVQLGDHAVF